jgi:hypothetical protein
MTGKAMFITTTRMHYNAPGYITDRSLFDYWYGVGREGAYVGKYLQLSIEYRRETCLFWGGDHRFRCGRSMVFPRCPICRYSGRGYYGTIIHPKLNRIQTVRCVQCGRDYIVFTEPGQNLICNRWSALSQCDKCALREWYAYRPCYARNCKWCGRSISMYKTACTYYCSHYCGRLGGIQKKMARQIGIESNDVPRELVELEHMRARAKRVLKGSVNIWPIKKKTQKKRQLTQQTRDV